MKVELPVHDATFDGLVMQDKGCTLFFSRVDGSGCKVLLGGVDALKMDDFREGNIVVFLGTTTRENLSKSADLDRLYTPPHPSAAADYHAKHAAFLERKIRAIISGDLTLVEMEPAIGATLLATCEHVRFRAHGDDS